MILLPCITSPYVRPKPANVRPRHYLRPVADQGLGFTRVTEVLGYQPITMGDQTAKKNRLSTLKKYP